MKEEVRWAPIWTDEKIIGAVLAQSSSLYRKVKKDSTIKFSFPVFEYEYRPTEKQELYFHREVDLANHLNIKSVKDILIQIGKTRPFKPFITYIEEKLIAPLDLPEFFRFIFNYLLEIPEIPDDQKAEMRKLASLPREILQDKVLRSGNTTAPFPFALADRYIKPILPLYDNLANIINNLAVARKALIRYSFKGEEFFVYWLSIDNKPSLLLPVYFPVSAKDSLPDSGEFVGRIIGIISMNPKLPLGVKEGNPFFIRAVSLFYPYKYRD